jgi:hypothetical protein
MKILFNFLFDVEEKLKRQSDLELFCTTILRNFGGVVRLQKRYMRR